MHISTFSSFILLSYNTVCLSIFQWKDTWVVSNFWLLWIKLIEHFMWTLIFIINCRTVFQSDHTTSNVRGYWPALILVINLFSVFCFSHSIRHVVATPTCCGFYLHFPNGIESLFMCLFAIRNNCSDLLPLFNMVVFLLMSF